MTDRELLDTAARAAGYSIRFASDGTCFRVDSSWTGEWNPLTDDGDALRLAVKLRLTVCHYSFCVSVTHHMNAGASLSLADGNNETATRRAIVHAAAAMAEKIEAPQAGN